MSSVLRSTGKTTLVGTLVDAFRSRGESHRLTRSEPEYGHSFTIQKTGIGASSGGRHRTAVSTIDELIWTSKEFE
jgi:hypothetical protein